MKRFLPGREDTENVRKILSEESVIIISVLKWIVLATVMGIIVGIGTTIFLKLLAASSLRTGQFKYYFLGLPLAMMASAAIIKYLAPDAEGHGTEKVIEAIHQRAGRIKWTVVPVKLVATIVTIASGGSAGKEGPCAQIGAGLSSVSADLMKFNDHDRKKLVICGISAGFASVFGTPIAGAIFGVEVLFAGSILYEVLLPSFISGVTAFQVSKALGISYFYHPINFVPVFSQAFFAKIVLAGIVFGLVSVFLIETLKWGERLSGKIKVSKPLKGLIGGAVIVALTFATSRDYLGLGLDTIDASLAGAKIVWYAFLMKALFTSLTLNFGGSGGIVTPIFFIGATSGVLFADIMHLDAATFAAVGLVCLLAGSANTPIAASILGVELFGPQIAPYSTVACVIAFLMTGHRSVYPSQILAIKKSESIKVELGQVMEDLDAEVRVRPDSVTGMGVRMVRKIRHIGQRPVRRGGRHKLPPSAPSDSEPGDKDGE
ncbi:MAG: chloride channel protein [Calditrichota bacterium]